MVLNDENFQLFAAMHYLNLNCETQEEFEEDLSRFKYLKKLFYVYENKKELKERLILNHIIILYNTFEAKACTKMLLLKLKDYYSSLLPFLMFLGYLPEKSIRGIYNNEWVLRYSDHQMDALVIQKLREIRKHGEVRGT